MNPGITQKTKAKPPLIPNPNDAKYSNLPPPARPHECRRVHRSQDDAGNVVRRRNLHHGRECPKLQHGTFGRNCAFQTRDRFDKMQRWQDDPRSQRVQVVRERKKERSPCQPLRRGASPLLRHRLRRVEE